MRSARLSISGACFIGGVSVYGARLVGIFMSKVPGSHPARVWMMIMLVIAASWATARPALATVDGLIRGTVSDDLIQPIPGATVTLRSARGEVTRPSALQSAQQLMATPGYTGIPGSDKVTKEPTWIRPPGAVDHLTLLAMAQDIEAYILGNIESETIQAMEAAKRAVNGPKIVRP